MFMLWTRTEAGLQSVSWPSMLLLGPLNSHGLGPLNEEAWSRASKDLKLRSLECEIQQACRARPVYAIQMIHIMWTSPISGNRSLGTGEMVVLYG